MDYKKLAQQILEYVGGKDNVTGLTARQGYVLI